MTQDKPAPAREPEFYWFHDNGTLTIARVGEDGSVALPGTDQKWDRDQICRGDRDKWGARIPTPAAPVETDKLLALARKCDETADLEAKIVAGEELRSLLGDRYEEFDKRYEELCAAEASGLPAFPWKAECVAEHIGLVPRSEDMKRRLKAHGLKAGFTVLAGMAGTPAEQEFVRRWGAIIDADPAAPVLAAFTVEMQRTFLIAQVPADAVRVWLDVATEALQGEPTDWESALHSLVEMVQARLPAQARAE